jgi:hypothetical protein
MWWAQRRFQQVTNAQSLSHCEGVCTVKGFCISYCGKRHESSSVRAAAAVAELGGVTLSIVFANRSCNGCHWHALETLVTRSRRLPKP